MSAETLRRAASAIREEHAPSVGPLFCRCEDSDSWFDRSICPEPCDSMHNICVDCGCIQGGCAVASWGRDNGNRLAASWLAVADWLETVALQVDSFTHGGRYAFDGSPESPTNRALAAARAYLGES